MTLNELRQEIDIDVDGSLARFSNFEPMYLKYLKRFLTEPTYDVMQEAIAQRDIKGIESAAHTLKGITGNLGLTTLFEDFNQIVHLVRSGDEDGALALCAEVGPKIDVVRQAIAKLD